MPYLLYLGLRAQAWRGALMARQSLGNNARGNDGHPAPRGGAAILVRIKRRNHVTLPPLGERFCSDHVALRKTPLPILRLARFVV